MTIAIVCPRSGRIYTGTCTCTLCVAHARATNQHRNAQPTRRAHRTKTHATVKRIVFARDPHACAECGSTADLTLDYIIPLIHRGRQHSDNARILCRSCNSRKGATVQ